MGNLAVCCVLVFVALFGGGTHSQLIVEPALQLSGAFGLAVWISRASARSALVVLAVLGSCAAALGLQSLLSTAAVQVVSDLGGAIAVRTHLSQVAVLSLLPAVALVAFVIDAQQDMRRRVVGLLVALVVLNLILGLAQLAQGPASRLRFYDETNPGDAVGLFANRNHYAALLYCGLILGAGYFIARLNETSSLQKLGSSRQALEIAVGGVLVILLIAGVVASRSRTAILLLMVATAGAALVIVRDISRNHKNTSNWIALGVGVAAVVLAIFLGLGAVAARFERDPLGDDRVAIFATTWDFVWRALPFGTGLASFESVYTAIEARQDLAPTYAHRAHNDWLELVLETGVVGVAAMVGFLAWFVISSARVWFGSRAVGNEFARPASLAILLLLIHSFLDYPLRTTMMQSVFAICCGLLFTPPRRTERSRDAAQHQMEMVPVRPSAIVAERRPWQTEAHWPEDWR